MSISSCPQCAKQITLPTGVSSSAKVRCPICRAQYTLAEALLNLPPLLEVIEDVSTTSEWIHPSNENGAELGASLAVPVYASSETSAEAEDAETDELGLGEEELEHDDFLMQDQDTEIEELGFSADPPVGETPIEVESLKISEPDEESVLDFAKTKEAKDEAAAESEIALDFDEITSLEEPAEEEITLDFGEPEAMSAEAGSDVPFDLDDTLAGDSTSAEEPAELDLEFGEEMTPVGEHAAAEEMPIEFGEETFSEEPLAVHADDEEIPLDFDEPDAAVAPVVDEKVPEETGKKGKKQKAKKEKKPREPKAASNKERKSLLGTLVTLLLGAVIAVPLALYGMLWLGPAFDFFGIGPKLPSAMVPASFSKSSRAKLVAQVPTQPLPTQPVQQPVADTTLPVQPPAVAPEAQAPTGPSETQAADKPAADAPVLPTNTTPDNPAPPEPPSSEEPAEPAPPAATKPAADSVDSLLDEPVKPAAEAQPELPEEMPAEDKKASDIADNAAAELASPEKLGADEPAEDPALPEEPGSDESPVRDAKEFSLADLTTATRAAGAAHQKMLAAQSMNSDAELKKARSQFYLSLYRLAEVLTFVKDPANLELSEQQKRLQPIVEQFVGDQKRLDAIKYNAGRWLGYPKRTTQGIMLAGTVQEVEQVGKLYQLKLGIGIESDAPIITVLQSKNPGLNPGDQAYVLGSIVANPTEQLAGYEGDELDVVWSGMTQLLPAAK